MGEKETMTGAGLVQDEAARGQFEKQHLGGMVQDEAARSQFEKQHLERQTPKRDFGDRVASPGDDFGGPAEAGRVRLDPTPARISTNMTADRMKAGLDTAGGILAGGAASEADAGAGDAESPARQATSGLKDTLKTQV